MLPTCASKYRHMCELDVPLTITFRSQSNKQRDGYTKSEACHEVVEGSDGQTLISRFQNSKEIMQNGPTRS